MAVAGRGVLGDDQQRVLGAARLLHPCWEFHDRKRDGEKTSSARGEQTCRGGWTLSNNHLSKRVGGSMASSLGVKPSSSVETWGAGGDAGVGVVGVRGGGGGVIQNNKTGEKQYISHNRATNFLNQSKG